MSLLVAREAGRQVFAATATSWPAYIAHEGDVAQARALHRRRIANLNSLGANFEAAGALNDLAEIEFLAGNTELALHYATDALARRSDFGDPSATMDYRSDVTIYLIALARYDEGGEHAREMLAIARERLEDVYAAFALQYLAAIAALRARAVAEGGAEIRSRAAQILGFSERAHREEKAFTIP